MIKQIKEQLEDPFIRKLIRYFLYFLYFVIFIFFYLYDSNYRYLHELTESQIHAAREEGRNPHKLNKYYYYFLALELTYLLVWLRIKHVAYKLGVSGLVLCNLAVILYSGWANYPFGYANIYMSLGLFFHADFLRRIWRRPKNKISS